MSNRRYAGILTVVLLIGCARQAAAQQGSTLTLGATIRTVGCAPPPARGDERAEGVLVDVDTTHLSVFADTLRVLPIARTLSLERKSRESHHLIGVVMGASFGFIVGGLLDARRENIDTFAGVPGQLVGSIVGAILGSTVARAQWTQITLPAGAGSGCGSRG